MSGEQMLLLHPRILPEEGDSQAIPFGNGKTTLAYAMTKFAYSVIQKESPCHGRLPKLKPGR